MVDEAGGGVVGTTARVEAAGAQLTEFACRGSVTSVGNNPFLAGTVDAVIHVAEVKLRLIPDTDEARAGEEVAIYRNPDFSLSDSAFDTVRVRFRGLDVRENFVLYIAELDRGALSI